MESNVRQPAVAGRFYPGEAAALRQEVEAHLALATLPRVRARAVVVPHAGYVYSGAIAGQTFGSIEAPSCAVVLCPNHTGQGPAVSLSSSAGWRLPDGVVPVDVELAAAICEETQATPDTKAHLREHAIEVELPFLRALRSDVSFVPICVGHLLLDACRELGQGIASAIARDRRAASTLLVASTDMSHYLDADSARQLDALAIERISALDPEGLYEVVTNRRISMCGFIPTTVSLFAAIALGVGRARLTRYGNSGERSGDFSRVVGYAGFVLE